jgi:hypothetical protein
MGKKGKNKQRKQQLATNPIGSGFTATSVVPPSKPVQAPPPPTAKMVSMAPPAATQVAAPPPATPAKQAAVEPGPSKVVNNQGTVVSVRKTETGVNISGKIHTPTGELFLHANTTPVPEIGTIVEYEEYEFNGKRCAKILKKTGSDEVIAKKHAAYSGIIYKLVDPASILLTEGEDPNVVGITPQGMYVYCIQA